MKNINPGKKIILIVFIFLPLSSIAQDKGIKQLDFLIGTWETREDNIEEEWWETSVREVKYILEGNFIEITANSINSNGNKRQYRWYINYNEKKNQFQMASMFSNWHKVQLDILDWDHEQRKLTIRNKPGIEEEFHERYGEIIFSENFDNYTWNGENKYGDPENPNVWKYIEIGKCVNN